MKLKASKAIKRQVFPTRFVSGLFQVNLSS